MCLVLVLRAPVAIDLGVSVAGKHSVDDLELRYLDRAAGAVVEVGVSEVDDKGSAAPIGVNADDVGNVHMIELVVGIVDDLGSPIGVASELKIEIKRAAVVPVDTVGRLGNADIRAVAIGDSLHLLIGSSLGVRTYKTYRRIPCGSP